MSSRTLIFTGISTNGNLRHVARDREFPVSKFARLTALRSSVSATAFGLSLSLGAVGFAPAVIAGAHSQVDYSQTTVYERAMAAQGTIVNATGTIQAPASVAASPFQISVDGDVASQSDGYVQGSGVDISIQYDGFNIKKSANAVILTPDRAQPLTDPATGQVLNSHAFAAYWNYAHWVKKAEIRIYDAAASVQAKPYQIIPVPKGEIAPLSLLPQSLKERQLQYVLRLYDANGNWDQTKPKLFAVAKDGRLAAGDGVDDLGEAWDQNTLDISAIDVSGAAVTVFGQKAPLGNAAFVMGHRVPISSRGDFIARQILPPGQQSVAVSLVNASGQGLDFSRDINIPSSELFYVGLGDLTIGSSSTSGPVEFVGEASDYEDISIEGQAAFFVKGKIRGDVLITAMADTGYGSLDDLINNIDRKDAKHLLQRIDPDKYYPVYGDDSTIEDLAASQGKIFVRIEKDDSFAMWGNSRVNITGPDFIKVNRGLYGAHVNFQSTQKNNNGQSYAQVQAYAAQPGTLPQRDEFRGTGGSLYFLSHQDITVGSETVRIEVRDPNTGVVLNSRSLNASEDYDVDYLQGRIILSYPLQSTVDDDFIVRLQPGVGGNPAYLVVNYEFTPATREIGDNIAAGGRAAGWLGDYLRVGVTGDYDNTTDEEKTVVGADVTGQFGKASYIKAEVARSQGTGIATTVSSDGGYTACDAGSTDSGQDECYGNTRALPDEEGALAYGVEAAVNLSDLGVSAVPGTLGAYFRHKDKGFAGEGQYTANSTNVYGVHASTSLATGTSIQARVTRTENLDADVSTTNAQLNLRQDFGDVSAAAGLGYTDSSTGGASTHVGGEVSYNIAPGSSVRVFGQTTVNADYDALKSTRVGVGGRARITDRLALEADADYNIDSEEVTGSVKADYAHDDRTNFYLGYETGFRTNAGTGTQGSARVSDGVAGNVVFGGRSRFLDSLSVFGEERLIHEGLGLTGLTHSYGVSYTPDDVWSLNTAMELGRITETATGADLRRLAASASAGMTIEGAKAGAAIEYRRDTNDYTGKEANSWLLRANASYQVDPNWRIAAKISTLISSENGDLQNGNYVDGDVGFAYRPTLGNRLNTLFKYRFYSDLPSEQVVNAANGLYKQRSHILSADVNFGVTKNITLGAKYGLKLGERTLDQTSDDFYSSTTHLGIVRADFHVVKNWDALLEARVLHNTENQQTKYGALVGVYRHIGDNFKIGAGYNFSTVSDDLTNTDADASGWFINAIAKF